MNKSLFDYAEVCGFYKKMQNRRVISTCFNNMGCLHVNLGNYSDARIFLSDSRIILEELEKGENVRFSDFTLSGTRILQPLIRN